MSKILLDEATVKQVLEALKRMKRYGNTFAYRCSEQNPYEQVCEAIAAIEALPAQKPSSARNGGLCSLTTRLNGARAPAAGARPCRNASVRTASSAVAGAKGL